MMRLARLCNRLRQDSQGTMVIETAIVAPVLVLLSLGAFQVSGIIARQTELQSAAAEAGAIALAAPPDTIAKRATLKQVVMASTGLASDKVTVTAAYRCDTSTSFVVDSASCAGGTSVSSFVRIRLIDTYTPAWTRFGVGSPFNFTVTRFVMLQQDSV